MNAVVINRRALSFVDIKKFNSMNTYKHDETIEVIVIDTYGETESFNIREEEVKDILESIPLEYKMKLN